MEQGSSERSRHPSLPLVLDRPRQHGSLNADVFPAVKEELDGRKDDNPQDFGTSAKPYLLQDLVRDENIPVTHRGISSEFLWREKGAFNIRVKIPGPTSD
ncbi:hypothetical protein DL769_007686 [Monosporascus sp. CRB-8-3]|nr:hypothetical protein DL769_007686 [Monosporascus sp. CRB-8-3]